MVVHAVASEEIHHVTVFERKVGKGRVLFIAPDIGSGYSQNPNRRSREVVRRLIGEVSLPYQTDAPATVQLTAWRQGGNLVFHLLNQPSNMYHIPCTLLEMSALNYTPEDFSPTCPIHITADGEAHRVFSPTRRAGVSAERRDGKTLITLDCLEMHDVIVLENWRSGD